MKIKGFNPIVLSGSEESPLLPLSFNSIEEIREVFKAVDVLRVLSSSGSMWDKEIGGVNLAAEVLVPATSEDYLRDVCEVVINTIKGPILIKSK